MTHRDEDEEIIDGALDHLAWQRREIDRLNGIINDTAKHWLDLQHDHPIVWEGAVDAAMDAACAEIRRLRAALGEK